MTMKSAVIILQFSYVVQLNFGLFIYFPDFILNARKARRESK